MSEVPGWDAEYYDILLARQDVSFDAMRQLKMTARFGLAVLVGVVALTGCAQPGVGPGDGTGQGSAQRAKKRIVAAALGDVFTVSSYLATGGTGTNQPGISEVEKLVHAGLAVKIGAQMEARLAEAVPTTDNGLWRVFPDGTMATTWRIRSNALWHDGTPFTSDDLLFTARAAQDREVEFSRSVLYSYIESIEAPDPKTITVRWKSPYIDADTLFSRSAMMPMPKHILEEPYLANRSGLPHLSYWNRDFVGTGPFRLREWAPSSHLIIEANDAYALGRPKVDEIEIRSIPSPTTSVANVLSGAVELTLGRGLSIDQSLAFRDQWRDGRLELADSGNPTMLGPQFLNPNPALVADTRFRRALYHALDREEMASALQGGLVDVAHSGLPFNDPTYDALTGRVVRYEYDPRKAVQMIQELGYARGPDGLFGDSAGQALPVQVVSSTTDLYIRTALAAASYWKRIGIDSEPYTVPDARERDLEFRANFPAFEVLSSGSGIDSLNNLRTSELRVAENSYRGRNRSRYSNAELDALIDRYYTTIPIRERHQALGDIVQHLTSNAVYLWLFYNGHAMAIGNRLVNVNALQDTANGHEWDVRL